MIKNKLEAPSAEARSALPYLGTKQFSPAGFSGCPSRAGILQRPREAGRVTGPGRVGDKRIFNLLIYIL